MKRLITFLILIVLAPAVVAVGYLSKGYLLKEGGGEEPVAGDELVSESQAPEISRVTVVLDFSKSGREEADEKEDEESDQKTRCRAGSGGGVERPIGNG